MPESAYDLTPLGLRYGADDAMGQLLAVINRGPGSLTASDITAALRATRGVQGAEPGVVARHERIVRELAAMLGDAIAAGSIRVAQTPAAVDRRPSPARVGAP
ncbi:MAG TPA: hypothetical protein VNI01_05200 [Elusimicrobiota bacterium]|jgi:hypothetical protein|nr:hypothetical protein [Elusimicrobiota bacterium]